MNFMDKILVRFLRFTIDHEKIYNMLIKRKWYKDLMYEEAQRLIGNRPRIRR